MLKRWYRICCCSDGFVEKNCVRVFKRGLEVLKKAVGFEDRLVASVLRAANMAVVE